MHAPFLSRTRWFLVLTLAALVGLAGCDDGGAGEPGDPDAAVIPEDPDAAELPPEIDAGEIDAAEPVLTPDAAPADAALPDAAPADAALPDAPPPTGRLRLVHAAPVAAALDVYLEGQAEPIFTALGYGQASAPVSLPPGSYKLEVREAGTPVATPPVYTSEPIVVEVDHSTTAVAAGLLGSTAPATQFRVTGLADGFAAPAPGKARVRVIHDSYSLPALAVDLGDDGSFEVASLDRFAASDATGVEVGAGADAQLALLGADTAHARLGGFVVPAALVGEGAELYAIVTGLSSVRPRDPRGLVVLLVPAAGAAPVMTVRQNPVLYLLAASPDATSVDAYDGASKLFENLAFGKIALRRVAPTAGGHTLTFQPTGARVGAPPLATLSTGPLEAGQQYLVVLSGLVTPVDPADCLVLRVYRDDLPLALDGNGRARVIHAATGVAAIDVGRYNPGAMPTWHDVADFAAVPPGGASVAAGTPIVDGASAVPFNPGVRVATDPAGVALRFASGALMNTDRFLGVFAGAWSPTGVQKPPRFIVVKTAAGAWTATVLTPL